MLWIALSRPSFASSAMSEPGSKAVDQEDSRAAQRVRDAAMIIGCGLLMLCWIASFGAPPEDRPLLGDELRYFRVGGAWASGNQATLDPLWPPGYPALLAGWIRARGDLGGFQIAQAGLHLVAALLLCLLGLRLSGKRTVGLVAGLLLAVDPQIAFYAWTFWPETAHLLLLLLSLLLAFTGTPRARDSLALGAAAGAMLLLKGLATPFVPLLLAGPALRSSAPGRWRLAGLALLSFVLVVSPAILHNGKRYGFWGVSDSSALNLYLGLSDSSRSSLLDSGFVNAGYRSYMSGGADRLEREATMRAKLVSLVKERGVFRILKEQFPQQYQRLFNVESVLSGALAGGSLERTDRGFRPPRPESSRWLRRVEALLFGVALLAGPIGLAQLLKSAGPRALGIVAWSIYLLILFYVVQANVRYRVPLLPVLHLGAATASSAVLDRLRGRAAPRVGGWTWIAALSVSAVLLWFAFSVPAVGPASLREAGA